MALDNDIQLWSNRDGLVFGLALTRRVLATSVAEHRQFEMTLHVGDLRTNEWHVSVDFLVARAAADGEFTDLTESDIRHWMFWLGLDHILHR